MTLSDLNLPAPWTYSAESSVRLVELGREGDTAVLVPAESWSHPEHAVKLFRTHDQPAESRLADLGGLYGIEVSGQCGYGRMLSAELEPHLQHARRRGWL